MSQKLYLPLDQCNVNAGYKAAAYQRSWGFSHYGIDLGNPNKERTVYSPGEGTVIAAGMDGADPSLRMGNALVLVFPQVERNDGKTTSLACRMFHLDTIAVKAGQTVRRGEKLGVYGNTGAVSSGPHLHLEFDTDVAYPQHAVGIKSSGNIIKKGSRDTTVNPSKVWYVGPGQALYDGWGGSGVQSGWITKADLDVPGLSQEAAEPDYRAMYLAEEKKVQALRDGIGEIVQAAGRLIE